MWRSNELQHSLPLLDICPSVGEIFLINNDAAKTPGWYMNTSQFLKKVKMYTPRQNIYVNPAFNIGVKHSHFDHIVLLQDDILFDPTVLTIIHDYITPQTGLIGINPLNIMTQAAETLKIIPAKDIKLIYFDALPKLDKLCEKDDLPYGWCMMMIFHKSNWIPIDEELLIHYGEEWINNVHIKKDYVRSLFIIFY